MRIRSSHCTCMLCQVDPRIQLSIPTAGSIPCEFKHTSWDYEQWGPCGVKDKAGTPGPKWPANYTEMYVMAALEPERTSIQIIHEHDPCCFHGFGRHERIIAYNKWVATQVKGHFETVPTIGALPCFGWANGSNFFTENCHLAPPPIFSVPHL